MTEVHLRLNTAIVLLLAVTLRSGLAFKLTENVARDCKVEQSSVWADSKEFYLPKFAVDGEHPDSNNFCSCTNSETGPWLRVTLPYTYMVAKIVISLAKDCCVNALNGAEIRVGNDLTNNGNKNPLVAVVDTLKLKENQHKAEYTFNPTEGRYVNIFIPNKNIYLIVCEVEVYAKIEEEYNLALKGRATQSSVYQDSTFGVGLALNAVDGNANPDSSKGSCSHTREENNPWWRIDLLSKHVISTVSLTNRGDCCSWRLDGAIIHIGDSLQSEGQVNPVCAVVSAVPAGKKISFSCPQQMMGRYVTIVIPGKNKILTLCEVEVFGFQLNKE